ncbi:MAG: hypothetical protein ACPHSE_01920 [Flavobacteriaceae bacterium]
MIFRVILFISLVLASFSKLSAQKYHLLKGKVSHPYLPVEGIHVVNVSRGSAEITDTNGYFEISVAINEKLIFSGIQFQQRDLEITEAVFYTDEVTIYLNEFVNKLDEVVVKPHNLSGNLGEDVLSVPKKINFSDVGIPGFKGVRKEKIVSKKSLILSTLLLPISGGINVEAVYKHLSGYYKRLKKKRKLESKFDSIFAIIRFYGVYFFIENYSLNEEEIYDFVLGCSDNTNLIEVFKKDLHQQVIEAFDQFNDERYNER